MTVEATQQDPIQRRRLHELLLERLLKRIHAGDPPPGEALPSEHKLMEQFGVGRPAVREALLRLEAMGLIVISHGERAKVLPPSAQRILSQMNESIVHLLSTEPRNLGHLKDARIEIEEALVRRATMQMSVAQLDALGESIDRQRRAVAGKSGYHEADMDFHVLIAAGAGNPLYAIFLRAALDWLGAFYARAVRLGGKAAVSLAEHEAIYRAMRARDADQASALMRAHLTRSSRLYG